MTTRRYPDRPIVAVGAIVVEKGRVLMARRGKEPSYGLWSVPGGAVHLGEDLKTAARREIREELGIEVELTDAQGGETLSRHRVGANTIAVVDRGYAQRAGLGQTLKAHGQVVVRTNAQNLPLQDTSGQKLDLVAYLRQIPLDQTLSERAVVVATPATTPQRSRSPAQVTHPGRAASATMPPRM